MMSVLQLDTPSSSRLTPAESGSQSNPTHTTMLYSMVPIDDDGTHQFSAMEGHVCSGASRSAGVVFPSSAWPLSERGHIFQPLGYAPQYSLPL